MQRNVSLQTVAYTYVASKKQSQLKYGSNLPSNGRPNPQRCIITTTQYSFAVELEAGNNVVIVTFHHGGFVHRFVEPVIFYQILAHVCRFPRASTTRQRTRYLLQSGDPYTSALFLPEEIIIS